MDSKNVSKLPKGRIIPVYLTDDGNVHPIFFRSMEELELCETVVSMALTKPIVVDSKHIINNPTEKISIVDITNRKTK